MGAATHRPAAATQRLNTEEGKRDCVLGLDATRTIKAQRERQLYHLRASGMYKIYYFITSTSFITILMLHSIFLTVSGILQDGIRTGACYIITLEGGGRELHTATPPARHGLHKPPTRVGEKKGKKKKHRIIKRTLK